MSEEGKTPTPNAPVTPPVAPPPVAPPVETKPPEAVNAAPPADSSKPPEGAKPAAPIEYKLKTPEGSLLDAARVEKIVSYSKERGFSNEQAQELLERESDAVSQFAEAQKQQMNKAANDWVEAVKTDKEIGGDGFKQNVALANRLVKRFGSEGFVKTLNETGLGNHPELVRFCTRIAKLMSEDQLIIPGAQAGGTKKTDADILYGSTQPN